jgi:MinD superfamily P-loop ATPase
MPRSDSPWQTIHLHRDAPPKPALGATCNGCGVCCAVAPCPIGMLISRRRSGRCVALAWQDEDRRYMCAVVAAPQRYSPVKGSAAVAALSALARRFISAGSGCDAEVEFSDPAA